MIYPYDSNSGPLKKKHNQKKENQMHTQPQTALSASDIERTPNKHSALSTFPTPASTVTSACATVPRFSGDRLARIWIPYGSGQNICLGRHLAKQKILLTLAALLTYFDVELIGRAPSIAWNIFGMGVLARKSSIRLRIKRTT